MRRLVLLAACCLAVVPCVKAQEDGVFQAGVFADYFRSGATGTNMFGIGGRVGGQILPHTTLEGELSYDFNRAFVNPFTEVSGGSVSYITSGVKTLQSFLGPRVTWEHGRIHPFAELKVGFVNYVFNNTLQYTSVSNQVENLRNQSVNPALLLGGGLEGKIAGPVRLRMDVGDQMYFNHGAQQGLKVTVGPYIRF